MNKHFTLAIRLKGKWVIGFTSWHRDQVDEERTLAEDSDVNPEDMCVIITNGIPDEIDNTIKSLNKKS